MVSLKKNWKKWSFAILSTAATAALIVTPICVSQHDWGNIQQGGSNQSAQQAPETLHSNIIAKNLPMNLQVFKNEPHEALSLGLSQLPDHLQIQWFQNHTSAVAGAQAVPGANSLTYAFNDHETGSFYYFAKVFAKVSSGTQLLDVSNITQVNVLPVTLNPVGQNQATQSQTVVAGQMPKALTYQVQLPGGDVAQEGAIHYQWYVRYASQGTNANLVQAQNALAPGMQLIPGATHFRYQPLANQVGSYEYQCQASCFGVTVTSSSFSVYVTKPVRPFLSWETPLASQINVVMGQKIPNLQVHAVDHFANGQLVPADKAVQPTYTWFLSSTASHNTPVVIGHGSSCNPGPALWKLMHQTGVYQGTYNLVVQAYANGYLTTSTQGQLVVQPFTFLAKAQGGGDLVTTIPLPGMTTVNLTPTVLVTSGTPLNGLSYHYHWTILSPGADSFKSLPDQTNQMTYAVPVGTKPGIQKLFCEVTPGVNVNGEFIPVASSTTVPFTISLESGAVPFAKSVYDYAVSNTRTGMVAYITGLNQTNVQLYNKAVANGESANQVGVSTVIPRAILNAEGQTIPVVGIGAPESSNTFAKETISWNFVIPSNIQTIATDAFWETNFQGNVVLAKNPALQTYLLEDSGSYIFEGSIFHGNLIWETGWEHIPSNLFSPEGAIGVSRKWWIWGSQFANFATFCGQVLLPNTVVSIQTEAFNGCTFDQNFTIPSSVQEIQKDAFIRTIFKDNLTFETKTLTDQHLDEFYDMECDGKIYVPQGYNYASLLEESYSYANVVVLPESTADVAK